MAALVRFVCDVEHLVTEREGGHVPALTIYEGEWAYCRKGGDDGHQWRSLEPALSLEQLRVTSRGGFVFIEDTAPSGTAPDRSAK